MAKGKTVSVTLPKIVIGFYDKKAEELGVSRSSIIKDIVMDNYNIQIKESHVTTGNPQTQETE